MTQKKDPILNVDDNPNAPISVRRTLVIGDTHGRGIWKSIVQEMKFDRFIFIGDYFDSWDNGPEQQINNYKDIVTYKENSDKEVIMLIGNHDFHYMSEAAGEQYSGFSKSYQYTIKHLLESTRQHLQVAYQIGNILMTHAGVTQTWFDKWIKTGNQLDHVKTPGLIAAMLEVLWSVNPEAFRFHGTNPYGDDITQGPMWVRSDSLKKDGIKGIIHVVGHTQQKQILYTDGYNEVFIDVLDRRTQLLHIDTYPKGKPQIGIISGVEVV